jgi:hypothetical protein
LEAPMNGYQTLTTRRWPISYLVCNKLSIAPFLICAALILSPLSALAQAPFKLQTGLPIFSVNGEDVSAAEFGTSVALSGDGNTAIVGGPGDNAGAGAAWVFTRGSNSWIEQARLTPGTGGALMFGSSVALSSDGTAALVGAPNDNSGQGAVWFFTRSGSTWNPQGTLPVNGASGAAGIGMYLALSADGNSAIIAGPYDATGGAVWFFGRSGSTWTQQGKISGPVYSVAMSGDGNTAMIGSGSGSGALVYAQSGGVWSQQAALAGAGATRDSYQASAVALSGDGNTAVIGGDGDAGGNGDTRGTGAVWFFVRNQGVWSPLGNSAFVGSGYTGSSFQGYSVALSADGNTAFVGGPYDNQFNGAAWAYMRGSTDTWGPLGGKLVVSGTLGCDQGSAVALSADGGTAIIGGPGSDNVCSIGSAEVYMRPAIAISATPNPVVAGNSTTLTWSATGTNGSCVASGAWNGSKLASNTQTVIPPSAASYPQSFAYTLTCGVTGGGNTSNTAFVTVTGRSVIPIVFNPPFCNLACVERELGSAGTAKPYGQAAAQAGGGSNGVLVLTRSGTINAMDVRHERDHDITTITVSPGATVIVSGDLGNDVKIVKGAVDQSKFLDQLRTGVFGSAPWIKLAAGKQNANTKVVGAAFDKGKLGGLIVTGAAKP